MVATEISPRILRFAEREIPVTVARNPRARRITLRLEGRSGGVRLVLPKRTSLREGLEFAALMGEWIIGQIDSLPARVPFEPGAVIPFLGETHVIRRSSAPRRGVQRASGAIWVSGPAEHLPRRVVAFLKAEARRETTARARIMADSIAARAGRISIRDMTSRWGSCGSDGRLSFSWRLILAPGTILDYVVAHEIAHLKELNHGPRFWRLVARLTPEVAGPRRLLRDKGEELLRYG